MINVNVASDFTRYPSGRYKKNGNSSGQAFREMFLVDPISQGKEITVQLDGTIGYGSSFLEEAFGGLVRELKLKPDVVLALVKLQSKDINLIEEIQSYIKEATFEK